MYLIGKNPPEFVNKRENIFFLQSSDFSIESNVKQLFEKIRIDSSARYFLFSAIGGYAGKSVEKTSFDDWKNMFKVNVDVAFNLAKYFIGLIKNAKGGSVCFTSAFTSLKPEENKSAYGASKAALNYLVGALAEEGKFFGLTANAVAPSIIDTPENREWVEDTGILVKPFEIAETVEEIFNNYEENNGRIIAMNKSLAN